MVGHRPQYSSYNKYSVVISKRKCSPFYLKVFLKADGPVPKNYDFEVNLSVNITQFLKV